MKLKMLAPWKKSYEQPRQHIKKKRHYFADKGLSSQSVVFPVVMYGCENWAIKKVECQRIDAFELWCWRRLLKVPWTARRSNQSVLQETTPEYSLEGLIMKLKLQYFGHWCKELTHWKRPWCWKDRSQEEKATTEDEMVGWHHRLNGHGFEQTPGDGEGQGGLVCCSPWGHKESDMTERLNNNRTNRIE